jgi:membrane-bound serine protease (ClpP class)
VEGKNTFMRILPFILTLFVSISAWSAPKVVQLNLEGAIHEGTVQTIDQALVFAKTQKAQALLITLDTPGGMLESTRKIVKNFLNETEMPIIVYVSPTGSRAGSAGTFITMAAHIAAMAPGTNIGAAHPVTSTGKDPEESGKHMAAKIENDTVAFMESIALLRGRNVEWAKKAVIESASIVDVDAKKMGVIDEVAKDVSTLLQQIDGRTVSLGEKKIQLQTSNAEIITYQLDTKTKVLNFLAHPTTIMILMTIIGLGLYAEFSNPGLIFPAVSAAIAVFLLLIANSIIPMTTVGSVLIFAGFVCLFLEIYIVSFGLLTIGGLALFITGSMLLFDPASSDLRVPYSLIFSISAGVAIVAIIITVSVGRTLRQKEAVGPMAMIGQRTKLLHSVTANQEGKVFILGEYWNATSSESIEAGNEVEITEVNGLTVLIKKVS